MSNIPLSDSQELGLLRDASEERLLRGYFTAGTASRIKGVNKTRNWYAQLRQPERGDIYLSWILFSCPKME